MTRITTDAVPITATPGHDGPDAPADDRHTWHPLRFLNLYRLIVSALFVVIGHTGLLPLTLGEARPGLFALTAALYFALSVAATLAVHRRWPPFPVQIYAMAAADVAAITLLAYASGGVASGLAILLVVTVAGTGSLVPGRMAVLVAAVATLAVLGGEVYAQLRGPPGTPAYTQAGILGITFFVTAIASSLVARRLRESEALAAQRGVDLANMAELNVSIVQHMQAGLVAVDADERVRLINDSARHLLGMPATPGEPRLDDVSPELIERLHAWLEHEGTAQTSFRPSHGTDTVLARFERLGGEDIVLIFLEDAAQATQQMQQMKLASLGRLTASIAHEIRNPLGAISHAVQLLGEGSGLEPSDVRLTRIIRTHADRMNEIIENVLQLSRRRDSQPQVFQLGPWLRDFTQEFARGEGIDPEAIDLEIDPPRLEVRMDPSHLQQVLWNLCQNGLQHGRPEEGQAALRLRAGHAPESRGAFIEVLDAGPGVAPDVAEQIFEPFFTTAAQGTGLGLYIARELCECNGARLEYAPGPDGGSCFRILFPERQQQVA